MEEIFSRDHDVSDLFAIFILKKESNKVLKERLYKVLEIMGWFRGKWVTTRYPVIVEGQVKSPDEYFDELVNRRFTICQHMLTRLLPEMQFQRHNLFSMLWSTI